MVAQVEYLDGQPFIHQTIRTKWTRKLYFRCLVALEQLKKQLKEEGFDYAFTYNQLQNDLWRKYLELFGWEYLFSRDGLEVYFIKTGQ